MKVKGIKITIILSLLASVLMPFSVFAAEQTQIVPTWNWGSQYSNQFTVTNFCEGSGTAVSCELRFTANNSYYGYLSFDGYNGTTKWIDYKNVWIADGYGAYRYSLYQNGVIQINKINIEGGFLKSSMDNLDLQDIIDLLTAIETDTTSIDNQINTELQRLQSIINNQIVQNGYLETLTKLRQYNPFYESYPFIWHFYTKGYMPVDVFNFYTYQYPVFNVNANTTIDLLSIGYDVSIQLVMFIDKNMYSESALTSYISSNFDIRNIQILSRSPYFSCIKFDIFNDTQSNLAKITFLQNTKIIPVFLKNPTQTNLYLSTDFCLLFDYDNELLDYLNIIANGNNNFDQSKDDLDDDTSDFVTDSGNLIQIEENYLDDLDTSLQSIDTNTGLNIFGGNFLTSATWVRTQFDRLTYNNPFGSLIVYGMTLGLALLLLGKVML